MCQGFTNTERTIQFLWNENGKLFLHLNAGFYEILLQGQLIHFSLLICAQAMG